ncbi:hypothetical protein B0H19DRAFT_201051 [Mycena capillaripes]|nr:hypothetical protein B0H19DRAFT_201051 [Mycena capillaripes]
MSGQTLRLHKLFSSCTAFLWTDVILSVVRAGAAIQRLPPQCENTLFTRRPTGGHRTICSILFLHPLDVVSGDYHRYRLVPSWLLPP